MKKEDTINKYIVEFLAEKSEEEREAFVQKDVARQYSAIMSWKRRMDIKRAEEISGAETILGMLAQLRRAVEIGKDMTEEDCIKIISAAEGIKSAAEQVRIRLDEKELAELKRKHEEIERRIRQLQEKALK